MRFTPIWYAKVEYLSGYSGHLRPFPGVAQVGVGVDGDHQPALVVEDAAVERREPVLLRRAAGHGVAHVRHLEELLDVVERAEDRVVRRQVDDRAAGQHAADLALEVRPLARAPEVVHHQEPARLQVAAQAFDLRLGEGHASDLDRVEEREPVAGRGRPGGPGSRRRRRRGG